MNYRRLASLGSIALSLAILSGCLVPLTARAPHDIAGNEATTLSLEDQRLLAILSGFKAQDPGFDRSLTPDGASPANGATTKGAAFRTQAIAIEAQERSGHYIGPFPGSSSMPQGYAKRPVGGWLAANPIVSGSGANTTVETWYTPGGDTLSPPAYAKKVTVGGKVTQDLYAKPAEAVASLPAFFEGKLALPADRRVEQSEETYLTYVEGNISGTALGYRWAVRDASNKMLAWIRAFQVTQADGTKVDRYVINSDYQNVNGVIRPIAYAYGTFREATAAGQALSQRYDPETGKTSGTSSSVDPVTGQENAFSEVVNTDRTVTRTVRQGDVVAVENYAEDGSGTGFVKVNGIQRATMVWGTDQRGTVTMSTGTAPYQATRWYPAPTPKPTASPVPTPTPTPMPVAILAGQNLKYQGQVRITSVPSGKGSVHANGDLDRSGSSNTDGALTYVGTSKTSGSHTPSSAVKASSVRIPSYTAAQVQALRDEAKAKGSIDILVAKKSFDDAPWQNGKRYATLKGYYSSSSTGKKLDFGGNWEITLDGIAYIEGGLDIGGSFVLKGNGIIVCADKISTGGNSTLGGSNSSSFALVSLSQSAQAVDTGGSTTLTGIVFAPNGGIKLQGNTTVNGCLITGGTMDLANPLLNFNANQTLSILRATY